MIIITIIIIIIIIIIIKQATDSCNPHGHFSIGIPTVISP